MRLMTNKATLWALGKPRELELSLSANALDAAHAADDYAHVEWACFLVAAQHANQLF